MRTSLHLVLTALLLLLALASPASAALSGNLISNGDFESTANLKMAGGNDSTSTYIPIHRSNIDTDWNRWLAMWGPPSQADNPAATAGFSTYNNPRNLAETGGDGTQAASDLGTFNRSVDPTNPGSGNHVMENILFRSRTGLWTHAPANQVAGPISFSFSFFQNLLNDFPGGWFNVSLYGLNFDFPHDTPYLTDGSAGNFITPILYGNPENLDGDLLAYCSFGQFALTEPHPGGQDYSDDFGIWHTVSTDDPSNEIWAAASKNLLHTSITETYDNYAVVIYSVAYSESHSYYWYYEGKITETPAILFDNINLRISTVLPGDMNLDGAVNVQDINPFVTALGSEANYKAYLATRMAAVGITSTVNQVYALVDPNASGVVNVQDINPFVALLAGAGVDTSSLIIPEPASLSLLALGALALLRRRH